MRCEEAKSRMIEEGRALDEGVLEHIRECADCARYAEATRIMERLLDDARDAETILPLAEVRDRVDMISTRQSSMEKIMSHLKDHYQRRPRLTAGMGLAVIVFLFVVLVPFSATHTVGWKASLEGIDAKAISSPQLINASLAAAGLEDIYIATVPGEDDGDDFFVKTPSAKEAREIVRAIAAAKVDSAIRIQVEPVIEVRSRPLLAQVIQRVKVEKEPPVRIRFEDGTILINGKGIFGILQSSKLTDAQVKEEIEKVLKANEIDDDGVSVTVETSEDGETRMIEIRAAEASLTHSLTDIELIASDRIIGLRKPDKGKLPDSAAVVQVLVPEKADTLLGRDIVMKISVEIDPEK